MRVDTICLDRDVLDETSISGTERVPFPLSFLLLPPSSSDNHCVRPSRSRWNNRREGSEEPGDYELGMTQPRTPSETLPFDFDQYARRGQIRRGDEVLRHTALSFSSLSGRPLESARHHPFLPPPSLPPGFLHADRRYPPQVRGRRRRGHKSGGRSCQTRGGARLRSPRN